MRIRQKAASGRFISAVSKQRTVRWKEMKVLSCGSLSYLSKVPACGANNKSRIAAVFILWRVQGQCRKILFYIIEIIFILKGLLRTCVAASFWIANGKNVF